MRMNENGNEKMLFVTFCCSVSFLVRVSICRSMPFAALRCSFLFLRKNQFYLKNQNRQMPFVARYGFLLLVLIFLWRFPFEHRIARCGFLLVRKTKTSDKRKKKKSKWKPGFRDYSVGGYKNVDIETKFDALKFNWTKKSG